MVNFYPEFVNCSPNATVEQVASKHCILCVCVCVYVMCGGHYGYVCNVQCVCV